MIRDQVGADQPSGVPTISINWSGYAAFSPSKFKYVFSTFVQPSVTCNGTTPEATSNWAGLDGYSDGTVEQDGTFAICGGRTAPLRSTKPGMRCTRPAPSVCSTSSLAT